MVKLGDYLWQRLYEAGVHDVFGVPGDFSLGLLNYAVNSKVNYVGCCNELNAAYAADGYARVKGIGAVSTTYAVGELSASNGVAGSYAESVPVLKVSGVPARKYFNEMPLLHHTLGDYMTPMKIYSKITIAQTMLNNPRTAAAEIDRVLNAVLRSKRPGYIAVPADMVEIDIDSSEKATYEIPAPLMSDPASLNEAVDEVLNRLASSQRPMFIPGVELIRRNLRDVFEEITNKSRIPFVTMLLSKGLLNEAHDNFVGLYSGDRSRAEVKKAVDDSDCVVIIGEKLTDFNTGGFSAIFDSNRRIIVDYECVTVRNHSYHRVYIHDFVRALLERIETHSSIPNIPRARESCVHRRDEEYQCKAEDKLTMSRLFSRFGHFAPENAIVIAETGASLFSAAETQLPKGGTFIGQTFYGSIGFSVGACLGACIACPDRPVLLFVGDGSFQVTGQELSTMIRYKCKPMVVLVNNDGYTIERVITDNVYNDIQPWKYYELPRVFGASQNGTVCKSEGDLEKALTDLWNEIKFIEVVLDKWDCNQLLKDAGKMMARNNNLLSN